MKGLIVLQRRFAPIGNAIAAELKDRYNVKEFCGFVITRRAMDIATSQKDISYTDLLLYEDMHGKYKEEKIDIPYLNKLEAEYGLPNLWPYLALDRTIMMNIPPEEYSISPTPPYLHEDMQKMAQSIFMSTISFLEKEKPDFIVAINVAFLGTMALYHIAKKMGIKYYTMETGKIGNRIAWSDNYLTLSGVEKIFKDIKENNYKSQQHADALKFIEGFRQNPIPPSFATEEKSKSVLNKILSLPFKLLRATVFTLKSTIAYIQIPNKNDSMLENPFRLLINKIKRKTRGMRNLRPLYDKVDLNEDFAYFPLHFEPEQTTLLYSPFYTNQINLLTQISKSLPIHFKLYVKEHPSMLEYRPTEYYKELKKIPNLKLVNHRQSSLELIQNTKIVLTISGTAGFEAALLKKPVITFGDIFYNMLSFVKRCREIENLPFIAKEQLENFKHNEQELVNFISAILEDTVPSNLVSIWGNGTPEQIEKIRHNDSFREFVASLAQKIGLKPTANPV